MELKQLKQQRLRLGLTQSQLAKAAGVSQSLITKIEAGRLDPRHSTVLRLEQALAQFEHRDEPTLAHVQHKGIITAASADRVTGVIKRMQREGISQLPVTRGVHIVGIITESTVLAAISEGKDLAKLTAAQVMDAAPPLLPSSTPMTAALRLLDHVPLIIVHEHGKPTGIVTKSDIIKGQLR